METPIQILIYGRPGHFRDSLIAVLKTLSRSELFLVSSLEAGALEQVSDSALTLILTDPNPVGAGERGGLDSIKRRCPNIYSIALVDNPHQSRAAKAMGVDLTLARSASAGELLSTIQRIGHLPGQPRQTSSQYNRLAYN